MKNALIIMLSFILFTACKKTVESEKRLWDLNLKETNELKFEYPSFSDVINDQIKIAQNSMNDAFAVSDEKLKIRKMSDSISLLNTTCVRNLKEIKRLKYYIRSKSTEARGLQPGYTEMMSINRLILDSERTVFDSDLKLKNPVNGRTEADSLSGLVLLDMKTAQLNLDRIISSFKEKGNPEKNKTDQLASDKALSEKKKNETALSVKCKYCGTLNIAAVINCKSCGAPLKK